MTGALVRKWICQSSRCGIAYEGAEKHCPQCGQTAAMASTMRVRGVAAIVAGLFLVGIMSMLGILLGPQLLDLGQPGGGPGFDGAARDGLVVFVLFAAIWLFGLVAVVSGAVMLVRGRRSTALFVLMMPPLLVIVTIVALILGGFVLQ